MRLYNYFFHDSSFTPLAGLSQLYLLLFGVVTMTVESSGDTISANLKAGILKYCSALEFMWECVETGQASGSARDTAPASAAPSQAISNPNSKQTQHGNDRRFYFPDLLRAACHYCDHLPRDTQLQVIITRFPINADGRITVPESEANILLHDLDNKRAPRGLPRRRGRDKPTVSTGGAYLARRTLALLRDAFDRDNPLEAPYLDPFFGYAGEDCAEAFDDEGFSSWYFDQA